MSNKIIVRCVRWNRVLFSDGEDVSRNFKRPAVYNCVEYFMVDLDDNGDGSVLERFCEPWLDYAIPGDLVCLESTIFSIPYIRFCDYKDIPPTLPYPTTGELVNRLTTMVYTPLDETHAQEIWVRSGSGSRLEKVGGPRKWFKSASVPDNFRCAVLSGTIYGLISGNTKTPFCYNGDENRWTETTPPLPPELHRSSVREKMLPDPAHGRILVLFESSLYAWHPETPCEDGSSWKCLEEFFSPRLWVCAATLINFNNKSLLFFFLNDDFDLFRVWCLDDHKFMGVNWVNEFPKMELGLVETSSICYLGNNQLCLAVSYVPRGDEYCHIFLMVFEIQQSTNTDAIGKHVMPAADTSDSITLVHVSTKTYRALDCRFVVDITHLGDVY